MGVDHNAYIGPYLRVTATLETKTADYCDDHDRPADAEFCPKCGRSNKDRVRKYEDDGTPDELNIPEITQKFTELFKEEIDYLKQWFGVEVKFGYIAWCS